VSRTSTRNVRIASPLHTSTVLRVETVEEIRRRVNAAQDAQKFRQQLNQPDRIIGRAFAELEEERRYCNDNTSDLTCVGENLSGNKGRGY
jgi:hypothetical protein